MSPNTPQKPLAGIAVVWTGSEDSGSTLLDALQKNGASVESHPLVEIGPPLENPRDLSPKGLAGQYSWLLFTSKAAASAMARFPKPEAKVAAVGPRTADRLVELGWTVDLVPGQHHALGLAEELLRQPPPDKPMLFVRGDRAKPDLVDRLTGSGIQVHEAVVYSTLPVSREKARRIARRIARKADAVILASPSGVETLAAAMAPQPLGALKPGLKWICLGPSTKKALGRAGIADAIHPEKVTPEELVQTAIAAFNG